MKFKEFFKNKENITKIVLYFSLFIISLLSVSTLFLKGFPMCDDSRFHFANILDMYKSIKNGNFTPISQTLGNGLGIGKGLFYSPLSHVAVVFLMLLGFPIMFSFKFIIFISVFLSGIFTYKLSYKITNSNKLASLLIASIYILFPYRIVDYLWRNAFAEGFAMTFLPLFFLGIYNILKDKKIKIKSYIEVILGAVFLFLSHNLTALYSYIFGIIFILAHFKDLIRLFKNKKTLIHIGISLVLIVGLCAINLFSQLELLSMDFYNISNDQRMNQTLIKIQEHVTYAPFFSGFYNTKYWYGTYSSDYLKFELIIFIFISLYFMILDYFIKDKLKNNYKYLRLIAIPLYLILIVLITNRIEVILASFIIVILYTIYSICVKYENQKYEKVKDITLVFVGIGSLALLMIMIFTTDFWSYMPKVMLSIQFPWRLFSLVQIFICILTAELINFFKDKRICYATLILFAGILVISNEVTLKRRNTYNELETQTNSNQWHFEINESLNEHAFSIGSCAEYCPQYYYYYYKTEDLEYSQYKNSLRPSVERELFTNLGKNDHALNPVVLEGKARIEVISKKAPVFEMDIVCEETTIIQMPLIYYPGYIIKGEDINGEKVKIKTFHVDGLVSFKLEKGSYYLHTKFVGSSTRKISVAYFCISLTGITTYIGYGIYTYKKSKKEELIKE